MLKLLEIQVAALVFWDVRERKSSNFNGLRQPADVVYWTLTLPLISGQPQLFQSSLHQTSLVNLTHVLQSCLKLTAKCIWNPHAVFLDAHTSLPTPVVDLPQSQLRPLEHSQQLVVCLPTHAHNPLYPTLQRHTFLSDVDLWMLGLTPVHQSSCIVLAPLEVLQSPWEYSTNDRYSCTSTLKELLLFCQLFLGAELALL